MVRRPPRVADDVVVTRAGRFGAVICAMATPFNEDGELDVDGAVRLARWLCAHGNDGLVLTGTTGESPALSDREKVELWRAVTEAVTVPVLVGTSTSDTAHSVELTQAAADAGVTGILAVTPYYSRPPQSGIEAHFRAIAAATDLPVMIYDIPVRSARRVAGEVLARLAHEVPNIVGVKDAAGDPAGSARLVASVPAAFELYSGDDALTLSLLAIGAVGVVSVASHWAGEVVAAMVSAFLAGDVDRARELNAALIPSWDFQSGELTPNPIPTKAMLRVLGLPGGQCRLPLGATPAGLEQEAAAVLAGLGERKGARAAGA